MSREYERKVEEVALWFDEHKRDGGDVHKKVEFLTKCVDNLIELCAHAARDLRETEGRKDGSAIFRPGQISVRGDLRRLG